MADLNILIKQLDNLTLLQAALLSKMLRKKWGLSAVRPITVRSEPPQPGPYHDQGLINQSDVVLLGFEGNKIKVIKGTEKK
jgi:ribosomal protein L7/L12